MFLKEQIELGGVEINGKPATRPSQKLRPGDRVSVKFVEPKPFDLEAVPGNLDILIEDDSLLVLNKRPGDVVHPAAGHRGETLVHYLLHHFHGLPSLSELGTERPGIVHRLDRGTSGCLLVAKSRAVQEALSAQFKDRSIKKEYEAVVWGKPGNQGIWRSLIGRDRKDRKKMSSRTEKGRSAETRWETLTAFAHFSHLRMHPKTGRTHQLRVHSAEAGYPIVGDGLYGRGSTSARIRGLSAELALYAAELPETLLHARSLTFSHPTSGRVVTVEAVRPERFTVFLERLAKEDR